jgi:hypothetical protein
MHDGYAPSRALDHFVCATRDVDVAAAAYQRMGFRVLPKMRHVEIGSCNRIVQLRGTYFELVSDLDRCPPALRDRLTARFACGEGLTMTSLTSCDLPGDHARLGAEPDLVVDRILNARRRIAMPDGTDDETDSHCFYVWHPRSTFLTLFLSEHYKPDTIWIPEYMCHANGAQRVVRQTFVAPHPMAERAYFERMLGTVAAVTTPDRLEFVTPRGETIEVLAPAALTRRFGAAAPPPCQAFAGHGVALRYEVDDLAVCRRLLAESEVTYLESPGMLTVPGEHAAGVVTEFVGLGGDARE